MKFLRTLLILIVTAAIFGGLMFALNLHTGPIIAENNKGEFGDLTVLYTPDAPGDMKDVGAQVLAIYKTEEGFTISCKTVGNFKADTPIKFTLSVSADGKITKLDLKEEDYTDTYFVWEKDPAFLPSFIGKDSALADVNLISGCTYSSKSIREAVSAALEALINNNLITAGVKSDDQLLIDLIPTLFPAMGTPEDAGVSSGNITAMYKAASGVGYAYIVKDGESSVLALVNAMGAMKVYNTEGADVTADKAAVVAEVKTHFDANKVDYATAANDRFSRLIEGAGEMTPIALEVYNNIAYAASFTAGEKTYYGFCSRVVGYAQMEIYIVIDEDGKIAKLTAKEFIFNKEHFSALDPNYDEGAYRDSFVGLDQGSFTGDNAMIGGATMTSNAVKTATNEAFAAFALLKGGNQA